MTPEAFFSLVLRTWAGGLSLDRDDNGNWYLAGAAQQRKGQGIFCGSRFDVTAACLAQYRGTPHILPADIASLRFEEAVNVFGALYYRGAGFDQLPFSPPVAMATDFGWGSGVDRAQRMVQHVCGAVQDGNIGPKTVAAWNAWVARVGLEAAGAAIAAQRNAWYLQCVNAIPTNRKYLNGWRNRTAWLAPGGALWRAW
jgi:lysozyme family protein